MNPFGTAGIRGEVPADIDISTAVSVGRAVGTAARHGEDGGTGGPPSVVLGHDTRLTGEGLGAGLVAGLLSVGAGVRRLGRVPTPVLAHASRGQRGVMVTASHNPPADNGFKLFRDGMEYTAAAENAVAQRFDADSRDWADWGSVTQLEGAVTDYCRDADRYLAAHGDDADGLPVAVDIGNGAAGPTTPTVLRSQGARVSTLNATPNGRFPVRRPKPTADALADFCAFVADGDFEVGFAHDGDGDRIVVVDSDGSIVHEDTILAILAEHYVSVADADRPIVITTPNASTRVDERVQSAGGAIRRVSLGSIHEGLTAAETDGTVVFAGEPWKHCHPRFGPWLDGSITAGVLARLIAQSGLSALRDPVRERPYLKDSVACPADHHRAVMTALHTRLVEAFDPIAVSTEHGLRIDLAGGGWLLCRPSGTEPCLRVYVESEQAESILEDVVAIVRSVISDATE